MTFKSLTLVCLLLFGQTTYTYQNHYNELRGPSSCNDSYNNHGPLISRNHRQSYEDALINEALSYYNQLNNNHKPSIPSNNDEPINDCDGYFILSGTSIHDFKSATLMTKTKREEKLKREKQEKIEAEKRAKEEAKRKQEQERIEAERKARELNDFQYCIATTMQDVVQIIEYQKAYLDLDKTKLNTAKDRYKATLQKRKDALTSYNHNCDTCKKKTYQFLDKAQKLLSEQSMKLAEYATFYGNKIQRLIHKEFVMIIHDTADMRYVEDEFSKDRESIATTIMRFVQTGELYNRNGKFGKAFSNADFCLGLLDCYGYILKETMVNPAITLSQCSFAATKGAVKGCVNFCFKAIQPERTLIEFSDSVGYLADATREYLKYAREERQKGLKKLHDQMQQDEFDLRMGKVTQWDLIERDLGYIKQGCGQSVKRVNAILAHAWKKLDKETMLYGIEITTEMATEMLLTKQTTSALGTLIGNGSSALSDIIRAGDGASKFNNLPLNGQTLQALISYEAVLADVRGATAQGISIAGAVAEEVVDGTSIVLPPFMLMAKSGSGGSGPKNKTSGSNNVNQLLDILEVKQLSNAEINIYAQKYDGICTYQGVPVKFRYDHNWNGDITKAGELGGMHHDILCQIEPQGLIQKLKIYPEKFYSGLAYFQGQWIKKSWFPNNWTIDEVMQSVIETIKNPNYSTKVIGDLTILEHIRPSGVIIRAVVNRKTGECISFYPRL